MSDLTVRSVGVTARDFWLPLLALILLGWIVPFLVGTGHATLSTAFGVLIAVLLAAFASVVLAKMITGEINLALLVSEDNGNASLSRFQFLIFTFVVGASYFLVVVWSLTLPQTAATTGYMLPGIPPGVLGLIGISGGSYVIAKGIQKSAETDVSQDKRAAGVLGSSAPQT